MPKTNKIRIIVSAICFSLLLWLYNYEATKKYKEVIYFLIIFLSVISYLVLAAFLPRYCKKCKTKMWANYPNGSIVPDYYYCPKCNCREKTYIHSGEY